MERRRIQQLSPSLVNRIAAGEVIERPASVVKELVENSIDAGATSIVVEIEDGGRELIRVIDDGGGMPPDDLRLAFAQHATSKLSCDEDLFRVQTMGFRGEALASVGAVSQARILSRTPGSEAAWEVTDRGGAIGDPQAAPGNVGTTVEVRNLFFNTPARRKFLKGASTELGHISDALLRLALPHPGVAFKLINNGRTTLGLPVASPQERLLAAWPQEFHEQRLPLDVRDAELRLSGIIGLPELASPTARFQFLYLNGRHIRDRFLSHALKEAYRGLTEPGRQPAAILLLTMPPGDVDVNVHPTKAEVRFRDSGRVHGLVLASIRERLLGSDLAPSAAATPLEAQDPHREGMRQKLTTFLRQVTPDVIAPESRPAGQAFLPVEQFVSPAAEPRTGTSVPPTGGQTGMSVPRTWGLPVETARPPAPPLAAAMQIHNAYLVAESDDGIVIIDQHALHERIMYEELRARLSRGPLESQRLLIPPVIRASARQLSLLEHLQGLLSRLGIEITAFGPDSVAVQAFPTFLSKLDPERFVAELLDRGEQELLDLHDEELLHEVVDMMACKAAVKAGDPLTQGEIEALLARRELVERSSNCPHGRPTTLRMSLRELEKQFKRTGF